MVAHKHYSFVWNTPSKKALSKLPVFDVESLNVRLKGSTPDYLLVVMECRKLF